MARMKVGFFLLVFLLGTIAQAKERPSDRYLYLKALKLERAGAWSAASRTYQELPSQSQVKQRRLFYLEIEHTKLPAPDAQALAEQVRLIAYQGDMEAALKLLEKSSFTSPVLRLQRAQMLIWLGRYEEAQSFIGAINPQEEIDQSIWVERRILSFWVAFLTDQPQKAALIEKELANELLYLPPQSLAMALGPVPLDELERWRLFSPESGPLMDELLERLKDRPMRIYQFCQTPPEWKLRRPRVQFCQRAELLISGYKPDTAKNPKDFEVLADQLVTQQDWKGLEALAKELSQRYPQLQDGTLYLEIAQKGLKN